MIKVRLFNDTWELHPQGDHMYMTDKGQFIVYDVNHKSIAIYAEDQVVYGEYFK